MSYRKRLLSVFVLIIFLSGTLLFLFSSSYAARPEGVIDTNTVLFEQVNKLQKAAEDYISESSVTTGVTELCFQYLRRNRYNDTQWNTLLGSIDGDFVDFVNNHNYNISIADDSMIVDLTTHKKVDFIHMIAVLNCYYKYGNNANMGGVTVSTDYSGWAGDLLTFLSEIYAYRTTNTVTDTELLQKYAITLLGTNSDSSFGSADMYADLDALNIYKDSTNSLSNLTNALKNYYDTKSTNYHYGNRVASARNAIGTTEDAIKTKADSLLRNSMVQGMLIPETAGRFEDIDYQVVEQAFANYMMEKAYIIIEENVAQGVVGEADYEIEMIESNLNAPVISMTEDICDVEIYDDIIYIIAKEAGSTNITISSENKSTSVQIAYTSRNVAPVITKDLEEEYKFPSGVDSSITIDARGTNNNYIWYLGDTKDGEFKKIGETRVGKLDFKPNMEMNGKYIKVDIQNKGNSTVTSKVAMLHIGNASIGDVVETGDLKLMLGAFFIILAFILNVAYYTIRASHIN